MGTTTLKDYGRHSEKYGDIGFYYVFNYRFWFGDHQIAPDDVMTWCLNNCKGYYKVTGYTHKSSTRKADGSYENRVIYADKVYLADEADALRIRLAFKVQDTVIKRPRIERRRK